MPSRDHRVFVCQSEYSCFTRSEQDIPVEQLSLSWFQDDASMATPDYFVRKWQHSVWSINICTSCFSAYSTIEYTQPMWLSYDNHGGSVVLRHITRHSIYMLQ